MQDPQNAPTGTCAVLITGKDRSLVANLGAANNFHVSHLSKPDIAALLEKAKYFYIEGFFLTHGVESALYVAKHAAETQKTFIMNISAPFLCQFFKEQLEKVSLYWDVLFGR
jgi:adenosine kinase